MFVRLTRKLADCLDGIDVSHVQEGDVLDLADRDGRLLVAEGWAVQHAPLRPRRWRLQPHTVQRLREIRWQMERRQFRDQELRRAEDRFREELRDARSRIVR